MLHNKIIKRIYKVFFENFVGLLARKTISIDEKFDETKNFGKDYAMFFPQFIIAVSFIMAGIAIVPVMGLFAILLFLKLAFLANLVLWVFFWSFVIICSLALFKQMQVKSFISNSQNNTIVLPFSYRYNMLDIDLAISLFVGILIGILVSI